MNISLLIEKWFWLVMVLVSVYGLVTTRLRVQDLVQDEPGREALYIRVISTYYIGLIILYAIMGMGILIGSVPTIFHFLRPQDGNPYVLACFASLFIQWIFRFYWIFFGGGAQALAKYPGVLTNSENPLIIKLQTVLVLIGGIAIFSMLFWLDFPAPNR